MGINTQVYYILFKMSIKEDKTGKEFPVSCDTLKLLGTGVRAKKIAFVNFNIYALGFYAEIAGLKTELSAFENVSLLKLEANQKFFDALIASKANKAFRLILARTITAEQLSSGLAEGLNSRCSKDDVKKLSDLLAPFKFAENTDCIFKLEGDTFSLNINGKDAGSIKSAKLVSGLMALYFDKKAISPDAKKSLIHGVPSLLKDGDVVF